MERQRIYSQKNRKMSNKKKKEKKSLIMEFISGLKYII